MIRGNNGKGGMQLIPSGKRFQIHIILIIIRLGFIRLREAFMWGTVQL
jgi:hypothetical protein